MYAIWQRWKRTRLNAIIYANNHEYADFCITASVCRKEELIVRTSKWPFWTRLVWLMELGGVALHLTWSRTLTLNCVWWVPQSCCWPLNLGLYWGGYSIFISILSNLHLYIFFFVLSFTIWQCHTLSCWGP